MVCGWSGGVMGESAGGMEAVPDQPTGLPGRFPGPPHGSGVGPHMAQGAAPTFSIFVWILCEKTA